jgi:CheY-like chemotaxis protein
MNTSKIVFIIDDDADDREIFTDVLKDIDGGYEVWQSESADDAMLRMRLSRNLPHYIFLDLNMPRVNGLECLKAFKENSNLRPIPIFLYSTTVKARDVEQARSLGASGIISKTSNIKALRKALAKLLAGEPLEQYTLFV